MPEADTFGKRLVLLRTSMGWHNAALAANAYGIPLETYRWYEKGKGVPRDLMEKCLKISRVTGADFGWLYGGEAMAGMTPEQVLLAEEGVTRPLPLLTDWLTDLGRPPDNRPKRGPQPRTGGPHPGGANTGPGRPALIPRRPQL